MVGLIREVEAGYQGAITVDGPRGPAKEVKAGIVAIASATQSAILSFVCYW